MPSIRLHPRAPPFWPSLLLHQRRCVLLPALSVCYTFVVSTIVHVCVCVCVYARVCSCQSKKWAGEKNLLDVSANTPPPLSRSLYISLSLARSTYRSRGLARLFNRSPSRSRLSFLALWLCDAWRRSWGLLGHVERERPCLPPNATVSAASACRRKTDKTFQAGWLADWPAVVNNPTHWRSFARFKSLKISLAPAPKT
jgi:hypothetical protein